MNALAHDSLREEALAVQQRWLQMRSISGADASSQPAEAPPYSTPRAAWVTVLTNNAYSLGVVALANSLSEVETDFPLVVLVTDSVPASAREQCSAAGCDVRDIERLSLPDGVGGGPVYACAHFAECWHKLRVWELDDFEQVALLDADMVVLKNMDELLTRPLNAGCCVRAVHECFCNVSRGGEPCPYIGQTGTLNMAAGGAVKLPASGPAAYFNSGLVVLRPSRAVFAHMQAALAASDLSRFAFPDQDFLNEYFSCAWEVLPYTYNATKGMYSAHRRGGPWDLASVRNLHFTMAKPWDLRHPCHKGYERLNQLWHAAYAEPHTLSRTLLQVHLAEKRAHRLEQQQQQQQQQGEDAAASSQAS